MSLAEADPVGEAGAVRGAEQRVDANETAYNAALTQARQAVEAADAGAMESALGRCGALLKALGAIADDVARLHDWQVGKQGVMVRYLRLLVRLAALGQEAEPGALARAEAQLQSTFAEDRRQVEHLAGVCARRRDVIEEFKVEQTERQKELVGRARAPVPRPRPTVEARVKAVKDTIRAQMAAMDSTREALNQSLVGHAADCTLLIRLAERVGREAPPPVRAAATEALTVRREDLAVVAEVVWRLEDRVAGFIRRHHALLVGAAEDGARTREALHYYLAELAAVVEAFASVHAARLRADIARLGTIVEGGKAPRRRRRTTVEMRFLVRDTEGGLERNRDVSERLERDLDRVREQVRDLAARGDRVDAEAQRALLASFEREVEELERRHRETRVERERILDEGGRCWRSWSRA